MEKTIRRCILAKNERMATKKDFDELLKIAELGEFRAQCCIAEFYYSGASFIGQNYQKSFEWYLKSARQNHFFAQYMVGLMYLEGKGIEQDENKALEWLKRSSADEARILVEKIENKRATFIQKIKKMTEYLLNTTKTVMMAFKRNPVTISEPTVEVKNCEFSEIPDSPISFCYKTAWIAIKTVYVNRIVEFLEIKDAQKTNWETGFVAIEHDSNLVFITPSIKGWSFIISRKFFEIFASHIEQTETYKIILKITKTIPNLYYFATNRVSECHCWISIKKSEVERLFCYADGEIISEKGKITKEEIEHGLNFAKLQNNNFDDDMVFPSEESVHAISSAWTIDTLEIENIECEKSVGTIGKICHR